MSGQRVSSLNELWWLDGEPQSALPVKDRGLAYGDGVFETMRLHGGGIPFLPWHLARLERGLKALAIAAPLSDIAEQISRFSQAVTATAECPAVIKLIVTRGVGGQGYMPADEARPTVLLQALPAPPLAEDEQSMTLAISKLTLAEQPRLAGIKHLNRLEYVLAASDVRTRYPSATPLLLNDQGHVIESLHHNIFYVLGGHLYTPELSGCGVAGVLRRWLLDELAPELVLPCFVMPITLAQLVAADEVFVGNSVRGFTSVIQITSEEQTQSLAPGPVCKQLQRAFLAKLAQ